MSATFSSLIFSFGIFLLIMSTIIFLYTKNKHLFILCNVMSMTLLIVSWVLREHKIEKYSYDYALQTGKVIGGTVYSSYPENSPGLGWI